jgi:hypothetical protein
VNSGNVTEVSFGGSTAEGFVAFKGRSSNSDNHDANGIASNAYPIVSTAGYNPTITMTVSKSGYVSFKLEMTAGYNTISRSYSAVLSGITMDLASIKIIDAISNSDRSIAINNLSITKGTPVPDAIADCKAWETSSAFATAIDAATLYTVDEVKAFHTNWQVENKTPSRAIFNNTVTSASYWWGTVTDAGSTPYESAPDNVYLAHETTVSPAESYNVNQIVYQLPAGKYTASAQTYSSAAEARNIYISKVEGADWEDLGSDASSKSGWEQLTVEFTLDEASNIAFGFYANAVDRTAGFDNWTLTQTGVSAKISSLGWSTFSSAYPLDFGHAEEGIEAYMITGVDGTTVTTSKVTGTIPAETGLLIKGTPSTSYTIPVVASSETSTSGNLMKPVVTATTVKYDDNSGYNYVLADNEGTPEFQQIVEGTYGSVNIAAGKAYLSLTTSPAPTLFFNFNDMTGIDEVRSQKEEVKGAYYNLAGQRVAQPTKGLYIVNGKKVIVR